MSSQNDTQGSALHNLFSRIRTNPTDTNQHMITAGPSKWDLMIALMHGSSRTPNLVHFYNANSRGHHVRINGLIREDGSGEKWLFEGFVEVNGLNEAVYGYYDCHSRVGWLRFGQPGIN